MLSLKRMKLKTQKTGDIMKGYEKLNDVLGRAYKQASEGKGKERHANDLPFHEQPMQQVANQVGRGFLLGQAIKKIVESQGMLPDRAVNELLGAINYIAGSIIHLEASNDNHPQPEVRFEPIIKNETVEYLDENYQLVDADIGIEIPDNWIRVPEGAVYFLTGFTGTTQGAFYDEEFEGVYPLNTKTWSKCWIGIKELKENGGVIVWQRK